nr:autotransporter domain-containing protein [Mesorhizobium loti]
MKIRFSVSAVLSKQINTAHAPYRRTLEISASILALTVAVGLPNAVRAEDWTGAVSTDWFTAGNWSPGRVPNAATDVLVDTMAPNPVVVDGGNATARLLTVGGTATGSLTISHGGTVSNTIGRIGGADGSTGTVTVDGMGSKWTNTDELFVGAGGTGTLTISNGGTINSWAGILGWGGDGNGTVTVTDAGSHWSSSNTVFVGSAGTGTLNILNGGSVSGENGSIGAGATSTGTVTVDGAASQWTNAYTLNVGYHGNGSLTISNGGVVKVAGAGAVTIARSSGSIGTLNIGGAAGSAATGTGTLNAASIAFGSGTGTINFNHTDANYTFAPAIQGLGTINQLAGNTTFTADSSGFTGTTNVTGGRLTVDGTLGGAAFVQSGGSLGGKGTLTGDVSVASGGTLVGAQGQTLTTGNLTLGSGSNVNVALSAPANATGLFSVNGNLTLDGTLNVSDAGGFGPGVYRIIGYTGLLTDNGLAIGSRPAGVNAADLFVQTSVASQVNLISSAGVALRFWDGGNPALHDNGAVDGGSGVWRADGRNWTQADGALNGPYQPNPTFAVFQGDPGTITVDNTAGAVSVAGMQFTGTNWTVAGDPITLNSAGGNTTIRVGDGTAGGVNHSATIGSELTGGGRLVKNDLGTLILTGANTYTGGTTIAAGTLQIGNGGTTGSIVGDVLNNGALAFDRSDATSFGGLISGSGAVRIMAGDLTFTADDSYAGGTDIVAGSTLRLGNGGTTGSIVGNVTNNGALVFNRANDLSFAGVISGSGDLHQIGSSKTELTGDSSGFTGATTIENGTLAVNGKLGGTLNVWSGGRLQGTGTVGDTIVNSTIAPGNSIGTINIGNITFNAGSIYEVEVNAAGQSDKVLASGAATINGGSVQVLAGSGNYAPATTYTIVTAAGGRTGTFSGVTSNLAFLDPSLSYDLDNIYLTMTRNDIDFAAAGLTPNQKATGAGAESLGFGDSVYNAVLNLSAPQARSAFDQLSGEIHASAKTAMIEDSRFVRNAVNDRLRAAFDGVGASGGNVVTYENGQPRAVAPMTNAGAVWGQAFGSWGRWNRGNAARLDRSIGGFFIGADAPAFDTWRFGAVVGYSRTDFKVEDRHSSGSSDNYIVGLYGGTTWNVSGGDLAFRSGVAYTLHDISTNRSVVFPGFADSLKGDYNAGTAQVFGELGYGINMGAARFEPFANLAYVNVHTGDFTEKVGAAALTSPSSNTDATFTTLGMRSSISFDLGGTALTAKGTLGWRHAFGDATPLSTMRFASGGGAFSIGGAPIARDAAVIDAGLDYALSPNATLGVAYGGQFGSGATDQSVRASFNVKF